MTLGTGVQCHIIQCGNRCKPPKVAAQALSRTPTYREPSPSHADAGSIAGNGAESYPNSSECLASVAGAIGDAWAECCFAGGGHPAAGEASDIGDNTTGFE